MTLVMNAAPASSAGTAGGPASLGERATVLVQEARTGASQADRANAGLLARAVVGELRRGGDATALQEAIADRLSPREREKFAEEVGRRVERHTAANARLADAARGLPAAPPRQVEAVAERMLADATDVTYKHNISYNQYGGGPVTPGVRTEQLSANELSYQLEELGKRDPALAAGVKAHLDTVLGDLEGSTLDRLLAGEIRPGENADLAFRHPGQGIEGSAKKAANLAMAAAELRPGHQDLPRFAMENRAQAGGGTVLEAGAYASGAGLVRAGGAATVNGARALAASQTARMGAATGGTVAYGTSVNVQMYEGASLGEAMTSERSAKALATGTGTGMLAGQGLPAREVAVGAAALAGVVELTADDIAGREQDLGNATRAAVNNGLTAGVTVTAGDIVEISANAARPVLGSATPAVAETGRILTNVLGTAAGEAVPPSSIVEQATKNEGDG